MDIVLSEGDDLRIIYKDVCPRCKKTYNSKRRKKTDHHVIPKFLKPQTEITVTLCEECHEELNSYYNHDEIRKVTGGKKPECPDFAVFLKSFRKLRIDFKNKKTDRGEFGEGLWANLVNHLEFIDERFASLGLGEQQ